MRILNWIKKHILRQKQEEEEPIWERIEREEFNRKHVDPFIRYPAKPGRQAIHQDIGKFMKHGRQSKYYRATVKAKKKPEDD